MGDRSILAQNFETELTELTAVAAKQEARSAVENVNWSETTSRGGLVKLELVPARFFLSRTDFGSI